MEIGSIGGMTQGFPMQGMKPPEGMRHGKSAERAEELASKIAENNDADGDGLLSAEELGSSFGSDMLAALDTDEDGLLSEEELQSGIQSKMEEARAGFKAGAMPSDENKEFMEAVHSLAGEEMPQKPARTKASQAYAMMQEMMSGGSQTTSPYNTDQLLLESLNIAV